MPLKHTTKDGQPAVKWGNRGKAYKYVKGNKASLSRAKRKATRQARAIKANS